MGELGNLLSSITRKSSGQSSFRYSMSRLQICFLLFPLICSLSYVGFTLLVLAKWSQQFQASNMGTAMFRGKKKISTTGPGSATWGDPSGKESKVCKSHKLASCQKPDESRGSYMLSFQKTILIRLLVSLGCTESTMEDFSAAKPNEH